VSTTAAVAMMYDSFILHWLYILRSIHPCSGAASTPLVAKTHQDVSAEDAVEVLEGDHLCGAGSLRRPEAGAAAVASSGRDAGEGSGDVGASVGDVEKDEGW